MSKMVFDPRNINNYSLEELLGFVQRGEVTFADLQKCGLRWDKIDLVKDSFACLYGCPMPETSSSPQPDVSKLYDDLLDDMRKDMMKYKSNVMSYLFGKMMPTEAMTEDDSPIGRFLKAGLTLSFDDLYRNGILPEGNRTLDKAIFKVDFEVPQLSMDDIGELTTNRTDVYFMGVTASGKSCILSGVLNYLHLSGGGQYVPYLDSEGKDPCRLYYEAIVKGLSEYKTPRSTGTDTMSFMQFNLGVKHDQKVTFIEQGDGRLRALANAHDEPEIWKWGIGRCLKTPNPKIIIFLVDYGSVFDKWGYYDSFFSPTEQALVLEKALMVFSSDGEGLQGERNCTMSKVSNVAVVITKSDLMDKKEGRKLTREERNDIAFDYLSSHFRSFMNNLSALCQKYRINANNKGHAYEPFVTTFSVGQFYLGNSVIFDPTDSKRIADFIQDATAKKRFGFFNFKK